MIKLGIVAALAGAALGASHYFGVIEMDMRARGVPVPAEMRHGRGMQPEFGIAIASLFLSWMGLVGVHRYTGICGRELWLPLGVSALAAVVTSLILVAVDLRALPWAAWKMLGISLPFMATGGILAVSMSKQRW